MDYCVFGSKLQFPKAPASAAMVIISLPCLTQSFFLFIKILATAHDCTSPAHNEVETKHLLWFLSSVLHHHHHHHHHTMCALLKSSSSCCFSQHYCEKSHLETLTKQHSIVATKLSEKLCWPYPQTNTSIPWELPAAAAAAAADWRRWSSMATD